MARKGKLPEDFGSTALSLEAQARKTSYGKLVAATTIEQRNEIVEKWRKIISRKLNKQ